MIELKNLPHRFARAMETHDVATIGEWVHEDYVQHNPFVPQGIPGVAFLCGRVECRVFGHKSHCRGRHCQW